MGDGSSPPPPRRDHTGALSRLSRSFAAWALNLLSRLSPRPTGLALVYHRVGDPHEEREDHLVPSLGTRLFEAQVVHLRRRYRPVRASELPEAARARRWGQRVPVAITFDDDLPSHARAAMPILRRAGVPATFFLCGASLFEPFAFWWERLQLAYDRELVEDELRGWGYEDTSSEEADIHAIAATIEAMPPARREQVAQRLLERLGGDPPGVGMPAADVRALAAAGFEIGFHTRRHDSLTTLPDEALERALVEGRAELAATAGQRVDLISYPHGRADRRVARAAQAAGYRQGFVTDREPADGDADPMLTRRVSPIHGSLASFGLQLARATRPGRH